MAQSWQEQKKDFAGKFIPKILPTTEEERQKAQSQSENKLIHLEPLKAKFERKEVEKNAMKQQRKTFFSAFGKTKKTATKKTAKRKSAAPAHRRVTKAVVDRESKKADRETKAKKTTSVAKTEKEPKGKKALMAKKMEHMREIARINKSLGISKKKK